jgi:crossover junction endodeoxyribonuclease RuvC
VRVLGIDPGSTQTGWGALDARGEVFEHRDHGVIKAPDGPLADRLRAIGNALLAVFRCYQPQLVAVEQGVVVVKKGQVQQGSLILAEARGVARYLAACEGARVVDVNNATAKKVVTGHGDADKALVQRFVRGQLRMLVAPLPDAADALAIAIAAVRAEAVARVEQLALSRRTRRAGTFGA